MSLRSTAQALFWPLFDNGSDQEIYFFDNLDQNADSSAYNTADFFSANLIVNMPAFAPDTNASTPWHPDLGDPGQLAVLDADGSLSPMLSNSAGQSPTFGGTSLRAGGLQFNLIWDSSVASAPAGFESAAIDAALLHSDYYPNAEVINVHVGYGEMDGG